MTKEQYKSLKEKYGADSFQFCYYIYLEEADPQKRISREDFYHTFRIWTMMTGGINRAINFIDEKYK